MMIFRKITSIFIPLAFAFQTSRGKSRRDGTLLTVGFNPRSEHNDRLLKSRRDDILSLHSIVPAGLWEAASILCPVRRLKPTVNKVLSLRDNSSLTRYCYKLFNFNSLIIALVLFASCKEQQVKQLIFQLVINK